MYKPLSKVLIVMIALFAFIGQTLAYSAMACEMAGDAHQAHTMMVSSENTNHEAMDHALMDHSMLSQDQSSNSDDCCGVNCICPANACTSFPLLSGSALYVDFAAFTAAVNLLPIEQPSSLPTSLYRPPIFA